MSRFCQIKNNVTTGIRNPYPYSSADAQVITIGFRPSNDKVHAKITAPSTNIHTIPGTRQTSTLLRFIAVKLPSGGARR
jgi:hypothetical protein